MIARTHLVAVLALAAGIGGSIAGQVRDSAPVAAGTATLSGTVLVAGPGRQPARRVRVTLNDVNRSVPGMTTTTDDAGTFVFGGVPAGRFELQAFRNGYLRASYGASRPDRPGTPLVVRDGDTLANLTMTIARGGVITGTVRDRQGQPLPDVNVRVLRLGYHPETGEPTLSVPNGSTVSATDDRGEYRAFGLPPGGYIVVATPAPGRSGGPGGDDIRRLTSADIQRALQAARVGGATSSPTPRSESGAGSSVNYAPVFHPDVTDISRATTITLGTSEERSGVDMTIELVPSATVSGRVSSPTGQWPAALSIVASPTGPYAGMLAGVGLRGQYAAPQADGRYTITGVAPGSYTLKATTGGGRGGSADSATMSAAVDIIVSGRDLDVPLALTSGVAVTGRVVFEGTPPAPAETQALAFQLLPQGSGTPLTTSRGGRVDGEGRFSFASVAPDTYHLLSSWSSPGAGQRWTVKRAVANGRDAFEAPLRVPPDEPVDLTVTFTDTPAVLAGMFQDRTGRAATDYYIVAFSADRAYWTPGSRRVRMTRPATDGAFEIRGLPAGRYLLGALTDLEPGEWHDPVLLEGLAKFAIGVTLEEGLTTTQDVRLGG